MLTGKGLELGRLADPARGHRLRLRLLRRRDAGDARRDARGQDLPGLRQRQRGPVHGREAARARRQAGHALRLERLHLRRGRHRPREARVRHGAQERAPRPHQGVRRQVQGRRLHPGRSDRRLQPALGRQGRLRLPLRDAERDQRQGRREPAQERRLRRGRGRQHAHHARRRRTCSSTREDPLRPGQGGQRRRRGHLGPGDVAEQHAPAPGPAKRSTSGCTGS